MTLITIHKNRSVSLAWAAVSDTDRILNVKNRLNVAVWDGMCHPGAHVWQDAIVSSVKTRGYH